MLAHVSAGPTLNQHWVNGTCLLGERDRRQLVVPAQFDCLPSQVYERLSWQMPTYIDAYLYIQGRAEVIRYKSRAYSRYRSSIYRDVVSMLGQRPRR